MSKTHELKTVQPHFAQVASGAKTFELRRDDRDYEVDDRLVLREYDASTTTYSGKSVVVRVTHVLRGFEGAAPGWVVLSIALESPAVFHALKWTEERPKNGPVYHHVKAGPLLLCVQESSGDHWVVTVTDSDSGETWDEDETFVGTLDEAKARAVTLGFGTLSPWVELARAEGAAQERETIASLVASLVTEQRKIKDGYDRNGTDAAARGDRAAVDYWGDRSCRVDEQRLLLCKLEESIRARKDGAK